MRRFYAVQELGEQWKRGTGEYPLLDQVPQGLRVIRHHVKGNRVLVIQSCAGVYDTDDVGMLVALPEQNLVLETLPFGGCQGRFQTLKSDNISRKVACFIDRSRTTFAYLFAYGVC